MNKIEEMIKRLCPNGVERVPVWRYTAWDKKFNAVDKSMQKSINKYKYLLAKDLEEIKDNSGDIRILYTTEEIAYTTEEKAGNYISEGEVIAIPWGGTPSVKYYKGRFITGDNRIATSTDAEKLSNKYLYYVLLDNMKTISKFYRGAGIKHPSMYSILTLEIPLPPLTIQHEIVSVLDSFTTLIDKMKQEVELRKKQMENYRWMLFAKYKGEVQKMENFVLLKAGKTISSSELSEIPNSKYRFKCYGGNGIRGYASNFIYEGNYAIIGRQGALCGSVNWVNEKFYATEHAVICFPKPNVESRFLYWLFVNSNLNQYKSQGAQPGLAVSRLNELCFSIPPLSTQRSIVSTLDAFEQYISKLERLITLREKQYAYYREKLLTFE